MCCCEQRIGRKRWPRTLTTNYSPRCFINSPLKLPCNKGDLYPEGALKPPEGSPERRPLEEAPKAPETWGATGAPIFFFLYRRRRRRQMRTEGPASP